jgi:cytochrome c
MKKVFSISCLLLLCLSLVMAQAGDKSKKSPSKAKKASAANVKEGQTLFKEKCAVCHYADKTEKRIGPGLKGVFKRAKLFDDRKGNEANIRELILNGGGKMVGFEDQLEPKQLDALVAYLKTL